jgi:hypothetical protein
MSESRAGNQKMLFRIVHDWSMKTTTNATIKLADPDIDIQVLVV